MKEEMKGFFAIGKELEWEKYAIFSYTFETAEDPEETAAHLCQEQSTAQWKRVGFQEDFRKEHGAKLIEFEVLGKEHPCVDITAKGRKCFAVRVKIAHPLINFGAKIPNLITAAAGEGAFFCKGVNSIKLTDVKLPESFLKKFEGPKFGIKGLRKMLQVRDRPLFLGVVKPNIGLKPKEFAELAYQAYLGGIDMAKDDEMLADCPYSPLKERVREVVKLMNKAEDKTGEKKIFVANITDELDKMIELHDLVVEQGGNAVMLNAMPMGFGAARMLLKKSKIPIFSHFDFIASFTRMPFYGVSSELITKIQRLSGYDAIIMPGFGERMLQSDEEVKANVQACLYDMKGIEKSLPVPGGSDWPGGLKKLYERLGTRDFAMVPGRAVFNHPLGPEAGAKSFRLAWEAIEKGIEMEEYAKTHIELQKSIEAFGG